MISTSIWWLSVPHARTGGRKGLTEVRDTATKARDTAIRAYHTAHREVRVRSRRYEQRFRRRWRTATPHQRQTVLLTTGAVTAGLVVAVAAVAASGPWDAGQRTAERSWAAVRDQRSGGNHTAPEAPPVLAALDAGTGTSTSKGAGGGHRTAPDDRPAHGPGAAGVPPPGSSALADTLQPLLKDGQLGTVRAASVVDAATGRQLYAAKASTPVTPASTVKLTTATAALSARGADYRIATRAVRGKGGRLVLVGGGDPTLDNAGLEALARQSARRLRAHGIKKVSLGYDTSRFKGPTLHAIGPNDNLAPVTPLMTNEARLDGTHHGPAPRSTNPSADAAARFAAALKRHGVGVKGGGPRRTTARKGSRQLAVHRSAPLSSLVERMLTYSDNDIAEALARQTALAAGSPASFKGAAKAQARRLGKLNLPLAHTRFTDGSGLNRADKVTAALLTRLLARAAEPDHPELRPILTGMPVAHFTGTLGARYGGQDEKPGAGLVRAKTGTLTGVNTLAGTVVDADGRLLDFAFMTKGSIDPMATQDSLDRLAAVLANCGCHDSPSEG
jgi:D-alanyl-D-alanine carboxypeptidase/D-alanyl-D-alanine-endopeptidase (penicillin-binding protein 4)